MAQLGTQNERKVAKAGPRSVYMNARTVELLTDLQDSKKTEFVFEKDGEQLREGALRNSWRRMRRGCYIQE